MAGSPRVWVVLLNWNNYPDSKCCLDSLTPATYPDLKVVNNGSSHCSGERFKAEFRVSTTTSRREQQEPRVRGYNDTASGLPSRTPTAPTCYSWTTTPRRRRGSLSRSWRQRPTRLSARSAARCDGRQPRLVCWLVYRPLTRQR